MLTFCQQTKVIVCLCWEQLRCFSVHYLPSTIPFARTNKVPFARTNKVPFTWTTHATFQSDHKTLTRTFSAILFCSMVGACDTLPFDSQRHACSTLYRLYYSCKQQSFNAYGSKTYLYISYNKNAVLLFTISDIFTL